MAKGPRGERRPGDVVGAAVHVAKIATGEIEDEIPIPAKVNGGRARARSQTAEQRSEQARRAALARWGG